MRPSCAAGDDLRFSSLDDLVRGRSFSSIDPALHMSSADGPLDNGISQRTDLESIKTRRKPHRHTRGMFFCLKTQHLCLKSYDVEIGMADQDIFILRVNFRAATETAAQKLNLRGLKSHNHKIWHVGPLSYLE